MDFKNLGGWCCDIVGKAADYGASIPYGLQIQLAVSVPQKSVENDPSP